ncbi:MAG: hypothetical protein JO147_08030 [Actinobacteria bacterium]|nr:hypothetical protein [Actinomycetota bacterium]
MRSGETRGLTNALESLDIAMTTGCAQQGATGATSRRIENVQTNASKTSLQLTTQLSSIQDVDVADMTIQFSSVDLAYRAALQTTISIRQTSLLDFLR